ncbi:hypothetical protein [Alkanindiges illinoisensis]|uniref:hypothetical protein n=1 Tax=Alkanindiges illinoisensis TaxID=197183 RepID=UPI000552B893|nr:hypothetical protein [Alkanindiges illinoisensis]
MHFYTVKMVNAIFVLSTLFMIIRPISIPNKTEANVTQAKMIRDTIQEAAQDAKNSAIKAAEAAASAQDTLNSLNSNTLELSQDTEVHAIRIYDKKISNIYAWYTPECEKMSYEKCYTKNTKQPLKQVKVIISNSKNPITLVLIAYQPINWTIEKKDNTEVNAIIFGGCCSQHVTGVTGELRAAFSHNTYNTQDESISTTVYKLTRKAITSYQEKYYAESFFIKNEI